MAYLFLPVKLPVVCRKKYLGFSGNFFVTSYNPQVNRMQPACGRPSGKSVKEHALGSKITCSRKHHRCAEGGTFSYAVLSENCLRLQVILRAVPFLTETFRKKVGKKSNIFTNTHFFWISYSAFERSMIELSLFCTSEPMSPRAPFPEF